jgi:hypothetical protein
MWIALIRFNRQLEARLEKRAFSFQLLALSFQLVGADPKPRAPQKQADR